MHKMFMLFMTLLFTLMFASGCSYYSRGPWSGRVLDADTKEPIEGAAVAAVWYYEHAGIVEMHESYYDAQETKTDQEGYFKFDKYRTVNAWLAKKVGDPHFIIFKPGYGTFPSYYAEIRKRTSIEYHGDSPFLGEGTIVLLPKLEGKEERLKNYRNVSIGGYIPFEKIRYMLEQLNIERKNLGLTPISY